MACRRPRPWTHCVRWGSSSPLPKKGAESPQFSAHVYCGQMAAGIKMPLGMEVMEVSLGSGHIVVDGDPAPLPKTSCLLCPNGWMNQNATWCRGRPRPKRHCVRWGSISPPQKGSRAPNFRPMSIVAKRCMDQDATLYMEVGLSPGHIVLDGDPASPSKRGTVPQFSAHVYCGQTVAHLSYC